MTADALTKPERSCTRGQSRAIRRVVLRDGGCCYCRHRSEQFETIGRLAACGLEPPRAFPACVAFGCFDFDEERFLGSE